MWGLEVVDPYEQDVNNRIASIYACSQCVVAVCEEI